MGEDLRFGHSRLPRMIAGRGRLKQLPAVLRECGYLKTSLITGGKSYTDSVFREELEKGLREAGIEFRHFQVSGEPSCGVVDTVRDECIRLELDSVLAVGGGSVIDTGKAVAAMMRHAGSVREYLEGVGDKQASGARAPLTAVPSTSGTGSEATKNAVISEIGTHGFKKSLRHEAFIPDIALLDPAVTSGCPADVTAAAGLDALTQLLEAYVSTGSSPFTDALALDGLRRTGWALPRVMKNGRDLEARMQMAYAAYLSGVCLANAGLGVVHGAASPIGALRSVPHGVVCGTLLPSATESIVQQLRQAGPGGEAALGKYARAAAALIGRPDEVLSEPNGRLDPDTAEAGDMCDRLVELLYRWVADFDVPRLSAYGFTSEDLDVLSSRSSLKGTPVDLSRDRIKEILSRRL